MEMSPADTALWSDLIYKELRGIGNTTFELDFQTHNNNNNGISMWKFGQIMYCSSWNTGCGQTTDSGDNILAAHYISQVLHQIKSSPSFHKEIHRDPPFTRAPIS